MILISHRGNLNGPISQWENNPLQIEKALNKGFYVEVDVRYIDGKFYLGHDEPQYLIPIKELQDNRLFVHAKDPRTLSELMLNGVHCFYHNNDEVTITSEGMIWIHPRCKQLINNYNTVYVLKSIPESISIEDCIDYYEKNYYGICSDYIELFRKDKE